MGSFFSSNKEKFLSKNQIDEICAKNSTIENLFNKYKNVDGFLKKDDIYSLFQTRINYKLVKRLYKIATSEKNQLNIQDFKYLYALFNTNDKDSNIGFLTDLIFSSKKQLTKEEFMNNVELIFKGDTIIQNKFFILFPQIDDKILKQTFQEKIKEKYDMVIEDIFPIKPISPVCLCKSDSTIELKEKSLSIDELKYLKVEVEFNNIEKINNGVFPIKVLENMLIELDVNRTLVNYICLYLKKKTQKAFIDFNNFKYLIEKFSGNYNEVLMFLYDLLVFPGEKLEKKHLENLIRSFKSTISLDEINKIFENLKICDNLIEFESFENLLRDNANFIITSTERIKYIPYIFFKKQPENIEIQKNSILLLMKGFKDLKEFINFIINCEKTYYIIDSKFWNDWKEHVNWNKEESHHDESNREKTNPNLKINLSLILDNNYNGKLKQGLVYCIDFLLISPKIWELFSYWYPTNGFYIKRNRIDYENLQSSPISNFEIRLIKGKTEYEIEIYPVFFHYFSFDEIAKNLKNYSFESVKEYLSTMSDSKNINKSLIFSKRSKYKEILKTLESLNKLTNVNSRLWVYYQSDLLKINDLNVCLNDDGISDYAILVLDVMTEKNKWYSENYFEYSRNTDSFQNSRIGVGLVNIGNSILYPYLACYMNAVMQIFLNSNLMKTIFLHENFNRTINYQNKFGYKGRIINEFIKLLKEKWLEDGKTIIPKKWKEIIGEVNSQFSSFDQQDANDFLNFILDALHEEINLKSEKQYINNPEQYNGTVNELACEYWSNNLRRNVSFIHSLFLGQMKSTLTCMKCGTEKISFETFSTLNVPIPQKGTICLEVILHRLPFTLKLYYDKIDFKCKGIFPNNKRTQLLALRRQSLELSFEGDTYLHKEINDSQISEKTKILNISNVRLNSLINKIDNDYDKKDKSSKHTSFFQLNNNHSNNKVDEFYTSKLTISIPIKISIEINKKSKISKIKEILKSMKDLELEETSEFTEFIVLNFDNKVLSDDLIIDECFQNNQIINIFEVLNYKGLCKLFNYQQNDYIALNKDCINYFNKTNQILPNSNNENIEIIVQIIHRHSSNLNEYFINNFGVFNLTYPSALIILTTNNSLKPKDLYEYIWEKYEYFLNNPSKIEKFLWWMNQSSKNIKACYPFILTLINKDTYTCVKCPWYRFCNGCIIDPHSNNFLEIKPNYLIVIEWCNEIIKKEFNENNIKLVIGHDSFKEKGEEDNKIRSLRECLNLFTEKEDLSDQDNLYCNGCFNATPNYKKYELERLPQMLIIILKRFKYTRMYKSKIDTFIDFPLYDLDMTEYLLNKDIEHKYDLYGIINHSGSLTSGHYISIVKSWKKWYKYDDSRCLEINENNVKSKNAYVLVYTLKNHLENDYLNMMNKLIFFEDESRNTFKPSNTEGRVNNLVKSNTVQELNTNQKSGTVEKVTRAGSLIKPSKVHPAENEIEYTSIINKKSPIKKEYNDSSIKFFNSISNFKYTLFENPVKFYKAEPVKTPYGKGYYDSEIIDNGIRYIKIKYKYGFSIMKYGKEIEKEIEFNPKLMEEIKIEEKKNNDSPSGPDENLKKSEIKKENKCLGDKNNKKKIQTNICSGCNIL